MLYEVITDAVDTEVITITVKDQDGKESTATSDVEVGNVLTADALLRGAGAGLRVLGRAGRGLRHP